MFCPQCGNQVPDSAQFCPKCGTRFATAPQGKAANARPSQQQAPARSTHAQPSQGSAAALNAGQIAMIVLAAIAAILPFLTWFAMKPEVAANLASARNSWFGGALALIDIPERSSLIGLPSVLNRACDLGINYGVLTESDIATINAASILIAVAAWCAVIACGVGALAVLFLPNRPKMLVRLGFAALLAISAVLTIALNSGAEIMNYVQMAYTATPAMYAGVGVGIAGLIASFA